MAEATAAYRPRVGFYRAAADRTPRLSAAVYKEDGSGNNPITNSQAVLAPDMGCVNCRTEGRNYTLKAHVDDAGADVDLPFCSTDCLEEWV